MSYVYPKKWAVLFQLDQKAALPVRFLPHFSAQEDPTLSGVSSIFYDLAEANPLVTFLFSIFHIYIYIMCLTMFRWIRGHTFHPPVTLYIYVHSWVLRETGVFYSWTWIIMLFSFLPHFSYQGCFRPNQFEVVWFCDLRPMYYSPVVPWALAWVVSRRESCFHSACKVWPSEISFVILCKTCLALCLCRTASCTVKAHWCRIFSFFFKLLIFNILRFQELVSWV
jgi:hypothetical protein